MNEVSTTFEIQRRLLGPDGKPLGEEPYTLTVEVEGEYVRGYPSKGDEDGEPDGIEGLRAKLNGDEIPLTTQEIDEAAQLLFDTYRDSYTDD